MIRQDIMTIAIGSLRQPKVDAVKAAMVKIAGALEISPAQIHYVPQAIASEISSTPMSVPEMMQGARNRVRNLVLHFASEKKQPDFYIGMEGGIFSVSPGENEKAFYLQSWVYAYDGKTGSFGSSPAVQFPDAIASEFQRENFELADIIGRFGEAHNSRNQGGAFSLLTKGLLTRQAIFESAVLAAMAPFYHPELYGA